MNTRKCFKETVSVILVAGLVGFSTHAQGQAKSDNEQRIADLEMKVEALLEIQGSDDPAGGDDDKLLHLHGYGELHYNNTTRTGQDDKMDFHRMVIGLGYEFTDRIVLDVEVDFEHAATEMELEFAYISFLLSESFNLRAGSMLMPVGSLNEFHEPPLFYSVERPYVQKYVIPTTWNEGGAGIFGSPVPDLKYRLYLVGGLDAGKFTASSGIRNGRGKVAKSIANDLAVAGRLEYGPFAGLGMGISGYMGDAGQDNSDLDDTGVSIIEADLRYRLKIFEVTALICKIDIDDTEKLNALAEQVIGEEISGWYVEGACHVGRFLLPQDQGLVVFVRHERFNTQDEVAPGFTADPANDREVTTAGLAYYPVSQLAVKADIETWSNEAGENWTQSNLGVAFMY